MKKTVIPQGHYFNRPINATPTVFNRVWDDINYAFSNLWDGGILIAPSLPYAILDPLSAVHPGAIRFQDATLWPRTVENVTINYTLTGVGSLDSQTSSQHGFVTWSPPGGGIAYSEDMDPVEIHVSATATYDQVFGSQEEYTAQGGQTQFDIEHPVSDPSSVLTYVNGTEVTHNVVSPLDTQITLSAGVSANDVVAIRYEWADAQTAESNASFMILPQPADGKDAIDDPETQIYVPATAAPLTNNSGSYEAEFTLTDTTLFNPSDSLTRQWVIKQNNIDVSADPLHVEVVTGSLGTALPTGGGSKQLVIKLKQALDYSIELNIYSTLKDTEYNSTQTLNVLNVWQLGSVSVNTGVDLGDPPFVKPETVVVSLTEKDSTLTGDFPASPLHSKRAHIAIPLIRISDYGLLYSVTLDENNGGDPDDVYEVVIQDDSFFENTTFTPADVRPGVDVFYHGGEPYAIDDISHDAPGDMITVSIRNAHGSTTPAASWTTSNKQSWGIGILCDSWIVRVSHKTDAGVEKHVHWQEVVRNDLMKLPKGYRAYVTDLTFGGNAEITIWPRHGNLIAAPSVLTEVPMTPLGSTPRIDSMTLVKGSSGFNKVTLSGSAAYYELFVRQSTPVSAGDINGITTPDGGVTYVGTVDTEPVGVSTIWIDYYPYAINNYIAGEVEGFWDVIITPIDGSPVPPSSSFVYGDVGSIAAYNSSSMLVSSPQNVVGFQTTDTNYVVEVRAVDSYGRRSSTKQLFIW